MAPPHTGTCCRRSGGLPARSQGLALLLPHIRSELGHDFQWIEDVVSEDRRDEPASRRRPSSPPQSRLSSPGFSPWSPVNRDAPRTPPLLRSSLNTHPSRRLRNTETSLPQTRGRSITGRSPLRTDRTPGGSRRASRSAAWRIVGSAATSAPSNVNRKPTSLCSQAIFAYLSTVLGMASGPAESQTRWPSRIYSGRS